MANKHRERCSTSLVIRKIMRCHYTYMRMAKIKEKEDQVLLKVQRNWNSHISPRVRRKDKVAQPLYK